MHPGLLIAELDDGLARLGRSIRFAQPWSLEAARGRLAQAAGSPAAGILAVRILVGAVGSRMEAPVRLAANHVSASSTPTAIDAQIESDLRDSLRGDGDAYARIIRRHQDALVRRMFRFSRNPAQVEELVHDVFVEAYFSLKRYRADAPFEHWLQSIATRVGYRFWKRRRIDRERTAELEQHERSPSAPTPPDHDAAESLARVLKQLPPRDRLVVTLLYIEERSVAEAAAMAGWSQTMIKVQAFRARGKLRKLLEQSDLSPNRPTREKPNE